MKIHAQVLCILYRWDVWVFGPCLLALTRFQMSLNYISEIYSLAQFRLSFMKLKFKFHILTRLQKKTGMLSVHTNFFHRLSQNIKFFRLHINTLLTEMQLARSTFCLVQKLWYEMHFIYPVFQFYYSTHVISNLSKSQNMVAERSKS